MVKKRRLSFQDDIYRPIKKQMIWSEEFVSKAPKSIPQSKCYQPQTACWSTIPWYTENPCKTYSLIDRPKNGVRSNKVLRRLLNVEQDVLQHRNKTVVTSKVSSIARQLFPHRFRTLDIVRPYDRRHEWNSPDTSEITTDHGPDPIIEWVENSRIVPNYYRQVRIDGVVYSVNFNLINTDNLF